MTLTIGSLQCPQPVGHDECDVVQCSGNDHLLRASIDYRKQEVTRDTKELPQNDYFFASMNKKYSMYLDTNARNKNELQSAQLSAKEG
jgi:hypothetical protein